MDEEKSMSKSGIDEELSLQLANGEELVVAIEEADQILKKKYQYNLTECSVVKPQEKLIKWDVSKSMGLFKIERLAYDKKEDNLEKLSNVYNSLSAVGGNLIMIIESDGDKIEYYIGVRADVDDDCNPSREILKKTMEGNFPGCKIHNYKAPEIERIIDKIFTMRKQGCQGDSRTISSVNGIPNFRNFTSDKRKTSFTQGIEKMLDSMRGEVYSVVIIADSIDQNQLDTIKRGYEDLYTRLSPFAQMEMGLSHTEGDTQTNALTEGISKSITQSLSDTQSYTSSRTESKNMSLKLWNMQFGWSESSAHTNGTSHTESSSSGKSTIHSTTVSLASTTNTGKTMQITAVNKTVEVLLQKIDVQLKRLSECSDLGMWNCSAYCIADDKIVSKTVASAYQALIRGEDSGNEAIAINTWHKSDNENDKNFERLETYIKKFKHPELKFGEISVNPTSLISSAELTIQAGLPQKSVAGLSVAEYAQFGREVLSNDGDIGKTIKLGKVYHMGAEEKSEISLDKDSLCAHTFITGATGSGKSNAVYQLLSRLRDEKVKFLVIEPAKGEYKHVFGNEPDVFVYGTNSQKSDILKINPFRFCEDIHVLEHIDRLIEIFNVCWPMYAAMPAVLKDAIEKAYEECGWDLIISENKYDTPMYPTFKDVLEKLSLVIRNSEFSSEVRSNYEGALVTRVKSLTNGIVGQIFVPDEAGDKALFERNVIIDLSRVASSETKALIMGMLVMRLQEYRIAQGGMNESLKHITVLEEAHNLLKRTSMEQVSESSNVLGKSVEMLSQSIAEMRTYGEGFIIADQSPSMLDMAAIRNTNTKIILRLPDMSDRELCGRAAGLDDEQILELAKLPTGIAAVYQNNWIEPVMCKVYFEKHSDRFEFKPSKVKNEHVKLKKVVARCLLKDVTGRTVDYDIPNLVRKIRLSEWPANVKKEVIRALEQEKKEITTVKKAITVLFDGKKVRSLSFENKGGKEIHQMIYDKLKLAEICIHNVHEKLIIQCVLSELSDENKAIRKIYDLWATHIQESDKNGLDRNYC